ncbi:astacin-like metalloprotease toxin 1 isoform X3 [Bradysia coprophila]|uniref:astacin-like metalloprotease toxin 1 isoform X2 n=1 Tax=Bradysia coprophila TaxID=38358 RepID=UPI00187DC138|nr:astacin-like metalloprotease toxin 1 isoform X2 [Bradysia coprophila]XP_037025216.1 astacin-like metalloprotease toxin 1 isoform X3 [Bradysia coprophila]
MNSKFIRIFVCFVINVINVCNVFTANTTLLDGLSYYNESVISKLSPRDRFNLHHAFVVEDNKWKNGRIGYEIDDKFHDREKHKIYLAMAEIGLSSCVRFVRHDPSKYGSDYVMIIKDYEDRFESSAQLGCRHQGKQFLWLGVQMLYDRDTHATILHELLHTIGFDHHHQRSDRDQYIEFHLENANLSDSDITDNYAKTMWPDPRVKFLTPFDFDSVMLYDTYTMSAKIKDKKLPRFQRQLSKNDKILLNRLYNCSRYPPLKENDLFYLNETNLRHPVVDKNETLYVSETNLRHPVVDKNETVYVSETNIRHPVVDKNEIFYKNETYSRHPVVDKNETNIRHPVVGKNETVYETNIRHPVVDKNETNIRHPVMDRNVTVYENETHSGRPVVYRNETFYYENDTNNRYPVMDKYETFYENETCSPVHRLNDFMKNSAVGTKWRWMAAPFLQCLILLVHFTDFDQ